MDEYELKDNDPTGKPFVPIQAPSKEAALREFVEEVKHELEFAEESEMGHYTLTKTSPPEENGRWLFLPQPNHWGS
jgi:hypothetical protein